MTVVMTTDGLTMSEAAERHEREAQVGRRRIAQQVADQHFRIACNDDVAIAHSRSAVYRASVVLLLAAIEAAYPHVDSAAVYGVFIDCNEPLDYCAQVVADDPAVGVQLRETGCSVVGQMLRLAVEG